MCRRDCLNCIFSDCIDNGFSACDYLDQVELEKNCGIFQPEDEKYFLPDLLTIVRHERRRARARTHSRENRCVF